MEGDSAPAPPDEPGTSQQHGLILPFEADDQDQEHCSASPLVRALVAVFWAAACQRVHNAYPDMRAIIAVCCFVIVQRTQASSGGGRFGDPAHAAHLARLGQQLQEMEAHHQQVSAPCPWQLCAVNLRVWGCLMHRCEAAGRCCFIFCPQICAVCSCLRGDNQTEVNWRGPPLGTGRVSAVVAQAAAVAVLLPYPRCGKLLGCINLSESVHVQ